MALKPEAKISIVIPVYNEENSVAELHREIVEVFQGLKHDYEIIFIDDGSTDKTLAELKKLVFVRIISFARNFGKSQALQAGFDEAQGDYIITLDGDLQDDPHEIPKFLEKLEGGFDLVCGWKQKRADSLSRRFASKIANSIARKMTGIDIHDMNCCFKIYKKETAKSLSLYGDMHRYIPSIVSGMGFLVGETAINHRPRRYGDSKYGFGRFASSIFDFITLIFLRRFTDRPMHFFGLIGIILSSAGVIILAFLSWRKIFYGLLLAGRPSLLLGILMVIVGLQLFLLGFISELIIRQSSSEKRNFVVKEKIIRNQRENIS
ncbi:MAG: glycosyltransferase family 2 protein [Candidatus Niyogibacteria bacterium]|nr:glycosyltransferase family 2 protein [Candidatus Niyogibacteria bacterium]